MQIPGRVQNGVVVLEGGAVLPEGAAVTVSYDPASLANSQRKGQRVQFPLVHTDQPCRVHLTNERIAEILDEEDSARYRQSLGDPPNVRPS
jgi:hypothetical protein